MTPAPRWLFLPAFLLLVSLHGLFPTAAWAAAFPPITDAEKALSVIEGQPGAPGVLLYRKAELHFRDYPSKANSRLEVMVRLKILTEEGKSLGEIELPHSRQLRLDNLEGRIVRLDGSEQALPKDAVFVERRSRSRKAFVTKAAFPNVEVGAILDFKYTFFWDSFYYLEPWFFHDTLPVLHSEVLYVVPNSLGVQVWGKETSSAKIQTEKQQRRQGSFFKVWMDNLPGLPSEPFSFPQADLSSRFMVIPTQLHTSGGSVPLLESWKQVSTLFLDLYKDFLSGDKKTSAKAKELAAGTGKDRREQARALYEFMRDEIRTIEGDDVWVREIKADAVLEEKQGFASEKSLLLYAMLDALKIPARLVWVANRNESRAELDVPNPTAFNGIVVQVELGGSDRISLDPSDRSLGFGRLPPYYESTRAIVVDRKNPESVILPANPYSDNMQLAELKLEVDSEGKVAGTGTLYLSGHYAWRWLRYKETPEATSKAWLEKLADLFPGFEPSEVTVVENMHDQQETLTFTLTQRDENVLGDEVSLQPSRPFVATQPLALTPEQRLTPVMLPFAALDEVHLSLSWPEDFEVDALPKASKLETSLGAYSLEVKTDPATRTAEITRRFSRLQHEFHGQEAYATLRNLYEKAGQSDAQKLVLVRP